MPAVLSAVLETPGAPAIAFLVILTIAVASLVAIGVSLRRRRVREQLTMRSASRGLIAASLVLAVAMLSTVALGDSPAVADSPAPSTPSVHEHAHSEDAVTPAEEPDYPPVEMDELEGLQLPTK